MTIFWRFIATSVATAAFLTSQPALARVNQPLSDIMAVARDLATAAAMDRGYEDVMVSIRPLDSRLAPALCDAPLQALPGKTKRTLGPISVGVRCNGSQPWTIYVRGTVNAYADIPVLTQSVPRGELISQGDIALSLIHI